MEKTIFDWKDWDAIDTFLFNFYNCTFIRDFGPFRAGEEVDVIGINYQAGIITEYDIDGNEIRNVKITLEPVDE